MPADLDRDGIEWHRQGVEKLLTHLSDQAEAWATTGGRRVGQQPVFREPSRVALRAAAQPGDPGVSLEDELNRQGLDGGSRAAA